MNETLYKYVQESTAHRPSRDFIANFIFENQQLLPDLMEILLDVKDKNHHKACWISELIFEKHIDWISLIKNDDNYKNILQVKIQKEFKTTPDYLEIQHDIDIGYTMGVYLCLGKEIYHVDYRKALSYNDLKSFTKIREIYEEKGHILVHFASGTHKIKKKQNKWHANLRFTIFDTTFII